MPGAMTGFSHDGHDDVYHDVYHNVYRDVYMRAYFSMACGGRTYHGCHGSNGCRNDEHGEGIDRHPRRHVPSGSKRNRELLTVLNCHYDGYGLRKPFHQRETEWQPSPGHWF